MKRIALLFATVLFAFPALAQQGGISAKCQQVVNFSITATVSATPVTVPNDCYATKIVFEEIISGSPSTMSIVIAGCMRGGSPCTTLDTSTSTTSITRKPAIDAAYDYFKVTATWTGGSTPKVVINTTTALTKAGSDLPNDAVANDCFLSTGVGNIGAWGACSGPASTNWSALVPGNLPSGNFNVPTGATITATGSGVVNANQVHGVDPASLATGIVKNTTGTGVESIAIAADFPTLNQNTTGTAANVSGNPTLPALGGDLNLNTHGIVGVTTGVFSSSVTAASGSFSGNVAANQFQWNATVAQHLFFGNNTGISATPGMEAITAADLPSSITSNTSGTAANVSGTPALPNGTTATTQTILDGTTKLATTSYADALFAQNPFPFVGDAQIKDTNCLFFLISSTPTICASADSLGTSLTIGSALGLSDKGVKAQAYEADGTSAGYFQAGPGDGTCPTPAALNANFCNSTGNGFMSISENGGTYTSLSAYIAAHVRLSDLTASNQANTIANGVFQQNWNWSFGATNNTNGLNMSESAASSGTGQVLFNVHSLSTSTAFITKMTAGGTANGIAVDSTGTLAALGTGHVNADQINGVSLSGLATGIVKNTTTTGVPSIAVAGDFPTLNQNTTGTAAGLTGTPSVTVNALTATTYNGGAFSGTFTGAPTFSGNIAFSGTPTFSNALALGSSTATTQTSADNSTKLATNAYVDTTRRKGYMPNNAASDQLAQTTANGIGSFATTQSVDNTGLAVNSRIKITARGRYTTTTTASPLLNLKVDAGGTTGICPAAGAAIGPNTSVTNGDWFLECNIQIATTGAPGTSWVWGTVQVYTTGGVLTTSKYFALTGTSNYTTNAAQTVTIEQTATMVTGQTMNLDVLDVDIAY